MKKILCIILISSFISCNKVTTIETKAHIFERKTLKNGKLMVYYAFNTDKSLIQDSSILENKVLPVDSVTVQFKISDPTESSLILLKDL